VVVRNGERISLLRGSGLPLVIGHRGAAAVAPENTLESLAAAVAAGVDFVEFDVGSALVLGHSEKELPDEPVPLEAALAFLSESGVGAHVDVKVAGIEEEILAAIRRHDFVGRATVSTVSAKSLRRFAELAPDLHLAIGYPHDRHGVSGFSWPPVLTRAGAAALRSVMPLRIPPLLRMAHANALALHHTLASRAALDAAHRRGVPVLAWTVNEPDRVRELVARGADGIVSDDPEMVRQVLATLNTP
jgi:glycerophosphoryl diester phosphodiesterase